MRLAPSCRQIPWTGDRSTLIPATIPPATSVAQTISAPLTSAPPVSAFLVRTSRWRIPPQPPLPKSEAISYMSPASENFLFFGHHLFDILLYLTITLIL